LNIIDNHKKTVLYVWKSPYPWDVRIEKICQAFVDDGFNVVIVSRWGNEERQIEQVGDIQVYRVGYKQFKKLFEPIPGNPFWKTALSEAILKFSPDLIIVREIMLAKDCGILAKKHNIPVVMDMAENYPAAMREWKKYNSNMFMRFLMHNFKVPDRVEANSVPLMDGIIVVCEEQINRLNKSYNYPTQKIVVAHNTPTNIIEDFEIIQPKKEIIFGHTGYLQNEKSLINFSTAVAVHNSSKFDFKLKLAGTGESEPEIRALIDKYNAGEKIVMLGAYKPEKLNEIISDFHFGVLPYQINDFNEYTIQNKIFDYFSLGKPVIVSPASPLKRVVEETDAGIIAKDDSVEAFLEVLDNIQNYDYQNLSKNAHQYHLKKYNWNVDSKVMLEFINGKILI